MPNPKQKKQQKEAELVQEAQKEVFGLKSPSETLITGIEQNTITDSVTTPIGALSSSSDVVVEPKRSIINKVLGQTVHFRLQNTSDADITLPINMLDIFSVMTLKANKGQTTLLKNNKETWLYPMRFLDQDTIALYRNGFMTSGSEVLAINESKSFYFPLIGDIFALNEIFLAGISDDISYEFSFKSSVWSGSVPDLVKFQLITRHQKFDPDGTVMMKHRYNNLNQQFRYREMVEMTFNRTLSPSSDNDFILNQFNSPASEVYVQVFSAGQMISDFEQHIDTYDITDEDDNSIIGSKPVSVDYHKFILNAAHDVSSVLSANPDPWLVIPLSSDSASDYAQGAVNGYHSFSGKDQLKIHTKSTLVEGNYKIRVYYAKLRMLHINQGQISESD